MMIMLTSAQGSTVQVDDAVAFKMHSLIRQIQTNKAVHLPYTSDHIINLVIKYCQSMLDSSKNIDVGFITQLDHATLFNLIQAAHHLKIKSLMDQTCQILVDRVKNNSSSVIMRNFNVNQSDVPAPKRQKRVRGNDRLRSHSREAFIDISDGVHLHHIHFDLAKEMKTEFSKTEDPELVKCVAEFLESSKFLVTESSKRITYLCSKLEPILRSFRHLSMSIDMGLSEAIGKLRTGLGIIHSFSRGQGLADLLSSEVASRLVLILDKIDLYDIQCMAARVLSCLSYDKCGNAVKEAVPVLLKAICSDINQVAVPAASTLARLAYESSKGIDVSYIPAVKEALEKHGKHEAAIKLSMFMVFVCRGNDLSLSDKVKVVLPILEDMIANPLVSVRACYALSYLTFGTNVALERVTCMRLMDFTLNTSSRIAGSALGVVGNIVRWGYSGQIKWLVNDFKLMQCLQQKVLCSSFKKFQMEGCRIISNLAARSEILIEDMDKACLTHLLNLLETGESDVKMEAAWAVFNLHYNVEYKQGYIDNYEKEMNLEVEQERSGLTN